MSGESQIPVHPLPVSDRIEQIRDLFVNQYGCEPEFYIRVPGR